MNTSHYYHCATRGLETVVLFENASEFIAGMNRIAFCLAGLRKKYPLILICFCLMDNHVHFILYGSREACLAFLEMYRRLSCIWLKNHRDGTQIEEGWRYDAWLIPDRDSLMEKIAYVHRNPQVAGIRCTPSGYRWSSANLLFSDHSLEKLVAHPLGTLSIYEKRRILGTRIELPDDWLLLPDGLIWPGCYTEFTRTENAFGNIGKYLFVLNQKVEVAVNQEMLSDEVSLPDGEIVKMAKTIAFERFAVDDLSLLSIPQRIELCRRLRKRAWAGSKQLARVFHLPQKELKEIIG